MTRYGAQYGPDVTFLGVDRCDLDEESSYARADVVVLGAPFDGGTSHRPGARFGPQAIRTTDYLPHDGSRPSLALRTDGLRDLRVVDAGDVEFGSLWGHGQPMRRLLESGAVRGDRFGRPPRAWPDGPVPGPPATRRSRCRRRTRAPGAATPRRRPPATGRGRR